MCFSNNNKLLRFLRMTSPAQVLAHLNWTVSQGPFTGVFYSKLQSVFASLYLIKIPVYCCSSPGTQCFRDFPDDSVVKNAPKLQETRVQSLVREDPLEEEMTTHSHIFAEVIPRTVHGVAELETTEYVLTMHQTEWFQNSGPTQPLFLLVHSQHHVGLTSALYRKVSTVLGDKSVLRVRLWAPKPQLPVDLLCSERPSLFWVTFSGFKG